MHLAALSLLLSCAVSSASRNDGALLQRALQQIKHFHNYSNLPIFIGSESDAIALEPVYQWAHREPAAAVYLINSRANDTGWRALRNYIMDDIVAVVVCESAQDAIWRLVDRRLRKLRRAKVVAVLRGAQRIGLNQVASVFQKLWQLQFLQAIVIARNDTYTYTPYPTIKVLPLSLSERVNPFPPLSANMQGYAIDTPVHNDIPRIFCLSDLRRNLRIRGFAYQIFSHFLKRLNATLRVSNPHVHRSITSSVNMSDILQAIGRLDIEISMHPYTGIPEELGIIGYPIFKVRNCLIVPVQNEIPRYAYLLRPYEWRSWLAILLAIFYISCILFCVERGGGSRLERISISFLNGLCYALFLSSASKMNSRKVRWLIIYLQLTALGFLLTTLYSNLLGSFLTTFLVGHQIDTFEDIIAVKFPILAKSYEQQFLVQQVPPPLVPKFVRLFVPVNATEQVTALIGFNRSFSYPVTEERWTFLALQQQYANKPIYRYSNICFGSPCVGYPMRLDSHLEHHMTQFIMDVQMAGLDHYWLVADFNDALKAGYVRLIDNILPFKALDAETLRVAFYALLAGWLVSLIAFFVEFYLHSNM